jgi:hypothetical protein
VRKSQARKTQVRSTSQSFLCRLQSFHIFSTMATIAFSQAGPSRLALSIPAAITSWRNTFLPRASLSSTVPSSEITSPSLLDSALQGLLELFPPFLLAVPKHKVTHSRKSMRSANKGLKNKSSEFVNPTRLTSCTFPLDSIRET